MKQSPIRVAILSFMVLIWINLSVADLNKDGRVTHAELEWYVKNVLRK